MQNNTVHKINTKFVAGKCDRFTEMLMKLLLNIRQGLAEPAARVT